MKHQLRQVLVFLSSLVALSVPGCTKYCTAIAFCGTTVELTFDPPIRASDTTSITITADDASLTGSRSEDSRMGPVMLWSQDLDGGGFVVTSADLDTVMPKHISYVVVADGVTVASGEVDLQYQHYTRGSEDCRQSCTTAYVTVPVNQ